MLVKGAMKTLCLLYLHIMSVLNLLHFVSLSCKPGRIQDSVKRLFLLGHHVQFQTSLLFDLFALELGFINISFFIDSKCSLCYTMEFMTRQGFVFPYIQIHLFQNP